MSYQKNFVPVTVRYLRDVDTGKLTGCKLVQDDGSTYKTLRVGENITDDDFCGRSAKRRFRPVIVETPGCSPRIAIRRDCENNDEECREIVQLYDGERLFWEIFSVREGYLDLFIPAFSGKDALERKLIKLGINPHFTISVNNTELLYNSENDAEVIYADSTEIFPISSYEYVVRWGAFYVTFVKEGEHLLLMEICINPICKYDEKLRKHIARLVEDVLKGRHRRGLIELNNLR